MKSQLHRADSSPHYRSWVKARDKALEELHTRAQLEATDAMNSVLTHVLTLAKSYFHELRDPTLAVHAVDKFDHQLKELMRASAGELFAVTVRLRIRTYLLAKTSEAEIIARLSAGEIVSKVDAQDLQRIQWKDAKAGGDLYRRLTMYMDRLRRRIVNQVQSSALNAPDAQAFLIDVTQAFPRRRSYKRPPRVLKPKLMEAQDLGSGATANIGLGADDWKRRYNQARDAGASADEATTLLSFEAESAWEDMVSAYREEFVPNTRAPEFVVDIPITDPSIQADGTEVWYAWEFERDLTHEFVQSVRDGQIEAANDNGITDFVWIAVIDSVTDACCRWRDGLLISEIEVQLDQHQDEDDECNMDNDGLTPPIHFNCRCTLAPALATIPEKPDTGSADFATWLEN